MNPVKRRRLEKRKFYFEQQQKDKNYGDLFNREPPVFKTLTETMVELEERNKEPEVTVEEVLVEEVAIEEAPVIEVPVEEAPVVEKKTRKKKTS